MSRLAGDLAYEEYVHTYGGYQVTKQHAFASGWNARRLYDLERPFSDTALNNAALALYGVSATYDRDQVRAALDAALDAHLHGR